MTIDINKLRRLAQAATPGPWVVNASAISELLDRLEAAEKERDDLRAKIERMERQEPVRHEFQGRDGDWHPFIDRRHYENTVADGSWPIRALYTLPGAKAKPDQSVPECPYPCGWRNLLKHAIEDGAYLARSINEDEPVTENVRAVTMRMVMHLRDVLMTINKAAAVPKPEGE